jgi:predicted O-methyltransferase YrrM
MNTLMTPPVASLLARLFAEASASDAALHAQAANLAPGELQALMQSADYRGLYARAKDAFLAVSRETGTLLYLLARASRARSIVEFGTSFGISTLHLAAAVKDNGGGRVIGSEFEFGKVVRAREHLSAAGLAEFVEIREGDAIETLARDLPETIDLVLLDGAKPLYPRVLALVEPRLREGALVIADNADHSPDYLARVRSAEAGYLSVPFAAEVELSMRVAASPLR